MYNKLFTKILDSSIWLADDHVRLVWITFLAAMDEDGFVQYATPANVAVRARVAPELAELAIKELESPEPSTAYEGDDGRRIERVPGGWIVLNAPKYREMVKRVEIREQTRRRVQAFRDKNVNCNASVTDDTLSVTPSDQIRSEKESPNDINFERFWKAYPNRVGKIKAKEAFIKHRCSDKMDQIMSTISAFRQNGWKDPKFIPHPATWINRGGWDDEPPRQRSCLG